MTETFINMVEHKAGRSPNEMYQLLGISKQRYWYYKNHNTFPAALLPKLKLVTGLSASQINRLLFKAFYYPHAS